MRTDDAHHHADNDYEYHGGYGYERGDGLGGLAEDKQGMQT